MTINPLDPLENKLIPNISDDDRLDLLNQYDTSGTSSKEEKQEPIDQDTEESSTEENPNAGKGKKVTPFLKAMGVKQEAVDQDAAWKEQGLSAGERFKKGFSQDFAGREPKWYKPQDYLSAAGAGVIDSTIGTANLIPGVDIPHLPQYENESLQATRDIASLVIPTLWLSKLGKAKVFAADKKLGFNLLKDGWTRWMAGAGIAAGAGYAVDSVAPVQERDHNMGGWLKEAWPKTWSWYPQDWATTDADSAEVKRQKNRNEGLGFGFASDLIPAIGRLFRFKKGIKEATHWVPKNETARSWLDNKHKAVKLSDDALENDVLSSVKKRDDELTELGQSKVDDPWLDTTEPTKGVHDLFDYHQAGHRSTDSGGIVAAGIDQVKIVKNIDTRYGRLGNFISSKNLNELLTGKQKPSTFFKKLGKIFKETDVDYVGSKGRAVRHADSLLEAEKLGAALHNTDLEGMKQILRPLSSLDASTGARKLTGKAYQGVMNAIKKYSDDFINLDMNRAEGLAATSVGGQVSDLAEGARLAAGSPSVESAYDQILDRLEFLMNLQGQTNLTRQKAFNITDIVNSLKRKSSTLSPSQAAKAIDDERNATLRALEGIANESKSTMDTLREVKKMRPDLLTPLMLAYEVTDGKVKSITGLNRYIRNTSGTVSKALFDMQPDMPSAWTQGVWANIYNSILSALGTPLKAALSNTVLMIERPLATFAGALAHGDLKTLRRAHYMYNIGVGETLQRSWSHMNQVFKKASVDPSSVGYIMRDDIARKNAGQIEVMRTFSEAAEAEGNYGPSAFTNHIEALNDLSEHPVLRFGANAMSAFDGFTRAFVGNIEARARAYDALMEGGGAVTEKRVRAMGRRVYGEMFDETGMITDNAVEYASKEIAMNLDNSLVSSVNEMIKRVPAAKPFLMFPKTSTNMLKFAGSHSPLGAFIDQLNAFELPFEQMPVEDAKRLLSERGVTNGNIQASYDTIRAELKGRKAIGTLAVFSAGGLFMTDRIRGNGIYDKTRQKVRRELGWKPKTFKGLDGKWYSYENLGPLTDWLALTADVFDNFDTLDEGTLQVQLQKSAFLLAANLTDKTFTAGLEPLGDIFAGNTAAMSRWAGTFGSAALPLSGFRNEFARLMTPQLKEHEQELTQIIANRNPLLKDTLPDLYDWMDGSKVGEPLSFMSRVWNVYSPLWKVSDKLTPEKQFLIDIEFDGRPTLSTNGKGVEYTPEQRSEITRIMGEQGYFKEQVQQIMKSRTAKEFRKAWHDAAEKGAYLDRRYFDGLILELNSALNDARRYAEESSDFYESVLQKQDINQSIRDATIMNDVEYILDLQKY